MHDYYKDVFNQLFSIVVLTFILFGFSKLGSAQEIKTEIDALAKQFFQDKNNYGLAVGLIQNENQQTFYYGGKFCKDAEDVDAQTIFEIGSITKLYTAYILSALEKDKKLSRFNLLSKYLPEKVSAGKEWAKKIRLIDLITHTSGLPSLDNTKSLEKSPGFDENNPFGIFTKSLLLKILEETNNVPDYGKIVYSNFGIGLLGYALEQSTGKTFQELYSQYIVNSMKLNSTHLQLNEKDLLNVALPHRKSEVMPLIQLAALAPSGAAKTTMPDLLNFLNFHLTPPDKKQLEIVNSILVNQLTTTDEKVGLGWGIYSINKKTVFFHTGGTYGSSSIVIIMPEAKLGVAILSNSSTEKELTSFAIKIMETLAK